MISHPCIYNITHNVYGVIPATRDITATLYDIIHSKYDALSTTYFIATSLITHLLFLWHHETIFENTVTKRSLYMTSHQLYMWHHSHCIYDIIPTIYDITSTQCLHTPYLCSHPLDWWHHNHSIYDITPTYLWHYIQYMFLDITPTIFVMKPTVSVMSHLLKLHQILHIWHHSLYICDITDTISMASHPLLLWHHT